MNIGCSRPRWIEGRRGSARASCAQAKRGELRADLRAPLLPLLLGPSSGGTLALLVRHALDDELAGTHCAAIDVLDALLLDERDEVRLLLPTDDRRAAGTVAARGGE